MGSCLGVGEVNYCLESGLCLLFGSSGTEGSMKGRGSEEGCCHAVVRGKQGELLSSRRSANSFLWVLMCCLWVRDDF